MKSCFHIGFAPRFLALDAFPPLPAVSVVSSAARTFSRSFDSALRGHILFSAKEKNHTERRQRLSTAQASVIRGKKKKKKKINKSRASLNVFEHRLAEPCPAPGFLPFGTETFTRLQQSFL